MMTTQPRSQAPSTTPHVCPIVRAADGRRRIVCDSCDTAPAIETPVASAPRPWGELPNWHVTWTGSATSDGIATLAPGAYAVDERAGRSADCVVAPGSYVTAYCQAQDPEGRFPETPAEAVRAWARQQGRYCG